MSGQVKSLIIVGLITVAIIVGGAFLFSRTQPAGTNDPVDEATLVTEDAHTIGDSGAPVTLVEFADFQCPACAQAGPIVKQVLDEHGDDVFYVFRHFPLAIHQNAEIAAQAAEAAGQQDKFFEMHDLLFDKQIDWATSESPLEVFQGYADELELDREKFDADMNDISLADKVQADLSDGNAVDVTGTPSFFINGLKHTGSFSFDDLSGAIAEALE